MRSRTPSPSLMLMPAASDATPVANGFTVDASTPVPAPRKMIATATIRSYPSASVSGTRSTKKPSVSSHIPYVVPPSANTDINTATSSAGLWRKRSARRLMPVSMAPVFIVIVMNAPTARTKRKICAEP